MDEKFVSIFPSNYKPYLQNSLFDPQKILDYWNRIFIHLKKYLQEQNIDINTYDISTKEIPYRYVYLDLPYPWVPENFSVWKSIFLNRQRNILICLEPPMINPFNYMKIFHPFFIKIYTWNDDLVDNKKYFKIRLPKHSMGINTRAKKFKDKKFLILLNTNKSPFYPFKLLSSFGKELYSERIKAIEFFEQNIPEKFYLYGRSWNKRKKYSLKEVMLGFKIYSRYKGEVKDKINILSNFKYCICFENITNVNGYITEKIFDCFKAKCVPIYLGASNIRKYIPRNCFIDYRDFGDYEKLITFLNSIDEKRYVSYIENIEKLLADRKFINSWFEAGYSKFFLEAVLEIKSAKI